MIIRIVKLRLSLPPSVINDSVLHTFILKITNLDLVKYKLWNMIWSGWADKFAQYVYISSFLITLFKFLNHPYVILCLFLFMKRTIKMPIASDLSNKIWWWKKEHRCGYMQESHPNTSDKIKFTSSYWFWGVVDKAYSNHWKSKKYVRDTRSNESSLRYLCVARHSPMAFTACIITLFTK